MKTIFSGRMAALALGLTLATVSVGQPASAPAGGMSAGAHSSGGAAAMHQQMMTGMQAMQSMKPTGDTDKDFAMMMRMHHQQAIEMANVELRDGKSAELKAMSRKIDQGPAEGDCSTRQVARGSQVAIANADVGTISVASVLGFIALAGIAAE